MAKTSIFEPMVAALIRHELEEMHYDTSSITDNLDLLTAHFTIARRLVPTRNYTIHEPEGFSVPADVADGYHLLKEKLQGGVDVTPHLHKAIVQLEGKDAMLFDWGIHHFHLGTEMEDYFIKRTGNVLYAIVDNNDFYCIAILPHQHWADLALLEIIEKNWPCLLDRYRLPKGVMPEFKVEENDIKELRKLRVNIIIQLSDDACILGAGGGFMSDGSSAEARRYALQVHHMLNDVQRKMEGQLVELSAMGLNYLVNDFSDIRREGNEIVVYTSDGKLQAILFTLKALKDYVGIVSH